MQKQGFAEKLLLWYEENHRPLPWRDTRDPYKIWLSEIILQQTRVDQGLPYYQKFISRYPSVKKLADAPEADVLRTWQGLGYYSRARNLLKCARIIVSEYQGFFPSGYHDLLRLPGVGPYTAAAIASFAFEEPVAVLDGNVFRFTARFFGIDTDITTTQAGREFREILSELLPAKHSSRFNQALMEFGALVCTPKKPECATCVFNVPCFARQNKKQNILPVKKKAKPSTNLYFNYLAIRQGGHLWMALRDSPGIWQGLYELLLIEGEEKSIHLPTGPVMSALQPHIVRLDFDEEHLHILSHRNIHARFYTLVINDVKLLPEPLRQKGRFYTKEEVGRLPKPILIDKYLRSRFF
ncbi:MAG: A/G-specific adenine glycosylase [Cyclobacteriaceae bacterium]|nr:A/G-specific adenine glycosylase [Cyclobacteriaceae bacterium]